MSSKFKINLQLVGKRRVILIRNVIILIYLFAILTLPFMRYSLAEYNENEPLPRSYGEGLADRLFAVGALSFYFDAEVQSIADHFTKGTRFAGKVQVNRPRASDYLNIYVFHYARALPAFLKNNCTAFSHDNIIICDHALLDSIPSPPPLVIRPSDGVALPLAMQWIIGHEIGHVLFQDDLSTFNHLSEGEPPMSSASTSFAVKAFPNKANNDPILFSSPAEVRADRFAIQGLPIQSLSNWIQLGSQLADAIYWEVDNSKKHSGIERTPVPDAQVTEADSNLIYLDVIEGGHPISGLPIQSLSNWFQLGSQLPGAIYWEVGNSEKHSDIERTPVPDAQVTEADSNLIYLDVIEGGHPPMLLRLITLLHEIYATYSDYPKNVPALNPDVHVSVRNVTQNTPQDTTNLLFYRGYYLGSDFDAKQRGRVALERALAIRSKGNPAFANLILNQTCSSTTNESEPWKSLSRLSCYPINKNQEVGDPNVIAECDRFSVDDAGRCYGALLLAGNECFGKDEVIIPPEFSKLCADRAVLSAQYNAYVSSGLKYSADDRLIDWILTEEYRFQRDVVRLSGDDLNGWVDRAIQATVKTRKLKNADELNDLYLLNSSITESADNDKRRISLLIRKRELRQAVGNMDDALAIAEEIVKQLDLRLPALRMERAIQRLWLGRMLREYRVVVFGENNAQEFVALNLLNEKVNAEQYPIVKAKNNEAPKIFLEAAELLRSPEEYPETKSTQYFREMEYLIALNDALFSYNMLQPKKVPDALVLARNLRQKLGAYKNASELKAMGYDFDLNCAAPAFENIAIAELASKDGNAEVALNSAKSSLSIRANSSEANSPEILRTVAYAYFAFGNIAKAKAVGLDFIHRWENTYHRKFDEQSAGMLVKGKVVPLSALVGHTDEKNASHI